MSLDLLIHRGVRAAIRSALRVVPLIVAAIFCHYCPRLIYHLPTGRRIITRRYYGRYRMQVDTTYFIDRCILGDCFEPDLLAGFARFITPGSTVIDIGANVGAATIPAAHLVGTSGRVIAFEPGPFAARLKENLALNPQLEARVQVAVYGLSDHPGFLYWSEDQRNLGNASLSSAGTHRVPITTLDVFLKDSAPATDCISLIKIDVEGMEYQVLCGARETILAHHPVITYETWRKGPAEAFIRITELLQPMGYQFVQIDERGRVRPATVGDHAEMTFAIPIPNHAGF